ncbi:hypothetical protein HPB47_003163 [Ixodes persulcatus]|uniref:Uncharacterized protein n=1 Tax=Ixodes persulcatus TaxID=34615 RepID=A0AC60PKC7_IXOPE|nr:hypothetical protein HPB47_003163 [Ixodes persulcatus]
MATPQFVIFDPNRRRDATPARPHQRHRGLPRDAAPRRLPTKSSFRPQRRAGRRRQAKLSWETAVEPALTKTKLMAIATLPFLPQRLLGELHGILHGFRDPVARANLGGHASCIGSGVSPSIARGRRTGSAACPAVRLHCAVAKSDAAPEPLDSASHFPLTCSALQWNCNGLRTRLPELRDHLLHHAYDAVALQEPRMPAGSIRIAGHVVYYGRPLVAGVTPRAAALLEEALGEGRSFTLETLSRVLQRVTREVRVPTTRPNPDLEWLELREKRHPADVLAYRRLDTKFKRHGKKLARRQWRLKCATLDKPAEGSRAWRMARTLTGHPIPQNPVLGMVVAMNLQSAEMAELLADAFTEDPPLPAAGPPPQGWSKFRRPTATPKQQPDKDFALHELQHALDALPGHRAAPDPDGITNQALRNVNESAAAGTLPDCFSGFRHHRSIADEIGDITNSPEEAKAQGWLAMAVFLNVRKAFNALPQRIIISALRRFGVCGRPLSNICAFLSERTMCVRVGGALSKPRRVVRSVVSPLLFALAIAPLPAAARVGKEPALPISMAVYVDDVALWATAPGYCRQRMACALQRALTNTVYHLHQLGLTTSAEKTVARSYAPRRPSKFQPTLFIGDVPVRVEKTATAAVVTARQLTENHLDAEYDGRMRVFTDGSVDPSGGTATAAVFFEAAAVGIQPQSWRPYDLPSGEFGQAAHGGSAG